MRWPYPRTPALGRDLPSNYAEGERVFDARVKAKFRAGTSEAHLVEELQRQGFAVSSPADGSDCTSATVTRGIVFKCLWSVRWRAKEKRIEEVWGVYGIIAP